MEKTINYTEYEDVIKNFNYRGQKIDLLSFGSNETPKFCNDGQEKTCIDFYTKKGWEIFGSNLTYENKRCLPIFYKSSKNTLNKPTKQDDKLKELLKKPV